MENINEKWIEEVLQSAKGMHPAAVDPYLLTGIEARVQQLKRKLVVEQIPLYWVLAAAAAIGLLLVLNISLLRNEASPSKKSSLQELVQEYGWNNSDFYTMNDSK
ncbi:MAG TPA: hypothetical protein VHD35_10045 [Chitinophagaceae bacterium]|nr:hypothetical protein [Chitinophagaceae bacterium]